VGVSRPLSCALAAIIGLLQVLQPHATIADAVNMDPIGDIAGLSTAMSTAKVQAAVATKVLKMAMEQSGQVASKLLESAMENSQAVMARYADDLGNNIDAIA